MDYYCLALIVVANVATSLLTTSNGIRVGVRENGPTAFNVLDYGATGDGTQDDTKAFLKAWGDLCGASGGDSPPTLTVPATKTFLVTSILFNGPCKSTTVHVEIQGTIVAPDSISGWGKSCESNSWLSFTNVDNLVMDGRGTFDGKGSIWWKNAPADVDDIQATDDNEATPCYRPTTLRLQGCNGLHLSELTTKDSPGTHIKISGCNNSTISNIHITAPEDSPNTDGIDISSTNQLQILDSVIGTGDDCIAIGSDNSFINITGIACGPGHGISVGSLGKDGAEAKVEEIHVRNCTFTRTLNGARIKTWEGGAGYARKITFDSIPLAEVQNPIIIDQFYCPAHDCKPQPSASAVAISDVSFTGFQGTSATVAAITLNCSQNVPCTNIVLGNIKITSSDPSQKVQSLCQNVKGKQTSVEPPVPCIDA